MTFFVFSLLLLGASVARGCDSAKWAAWVDELARCEREAIKTSEAALLDPGVADPGNFYFCDCLNLFYFNASRTTDAGDDCLGLKNRPGRPQLNNVTYVANYCSKFECSKCEVLLEGSCDSVCEDHCAGIMPAPDSTAPPVTNNSTTAAGTAGSTTAAGATSGTTMAMTTQQTTTGTPMATTSAAATTATTAAETTTTAAAAATTSATAASNETTAANATTTAAPDRRKRALLSTTAIATSNGTFTKPCIPYLEYQELSETGRWPPLPSNYFDEDWKRNPDYLDYDTKDYKGWPIGYFEGFINDPEDTAEWPIICEPVRWELCACKCCPAGQRPCDVEGVIRNPCDLDVDYNAKVCVENYRDCPEGVVVLNALCNAASSLGPFSLALLVAMVLVVFQF